MKEAGRKEIEPKGAGYKENIIIMVDYSVHDPFGHIQEFVQ